MHRLFNLASSGWHHKVKHSAPVASSKFASNNNKWGTEVTRHINQRVTAVSRKNKNLREVANDYGLKRTASSRLSSLGPVGIVKRA